ncbi:L,D-transpeptidase family protein [Halarcobacter ebronensis]|uniref:L,D-transpeptidase family protein n=1 Tax=Halarcobacter ebronensis TaxID=1462615 RepID=UPI003C752524
MKKLLLLLFFMVTYLLADLVDVYRNQGLDAVRAELEKELTKKQYWENYLSNKNVEYGYYESKEFLIIAEKQKKEIKVFKVEKDNYNLLLKEDIIVGEKEGDKQVEGDLKTPEGAYMLTKKLTKLDQFYGPLALVTSYPNTFDKALNKNGHGIWIHGMPLNEEREKFTQGCIALDNEQLQAIDKSIAHEKSILLISDEHLPKTSKEEISTILAAIYKWREAWKKSDIDEYLNFYSESFKNDRGMTLEEFAKYKKRIFAKKEEKKIVFTNINIAPYPNSLNKNMYKVLMDEDYKTKYYTFVGKKELYIELKDNKVQILAEG